jgi:Putative lumazine-binding
MKKLALITLTVLSLNAYSQTDKEAVNNAVLDYVDAFYFGDTAKIVRSISPAVVKYGYYRKKDELVYNGEPMSYQEMLDYAASVKKRNNPNAANLVKKIEVLDVLDQTASAKLTAWWGNDYILLAKQNGKWVITHVLWQSPPRTN